MPNSPTTPPGISSPTSSSCASISAEHGIGLVKRAYLDSTRSAAEIDLMRGVRKVFDPRGILNPGKLFAGD